jgi:hypothetical protein
LWVQDNWQYGHQQSVQRRKPICARHFRAFAPCDMAIKIDAFDPRLLGEISHDCSLDPRVGFRIRKLAFPQLPDTHYTVQRKLALGQALYGGKRGYV